MRSPDDDYALISSLITIAKADPSLTEAMRVARDLGLPSWCIGAGAVRSLVWDALHGFESRTPTPDVDFVYFDPNDLSPERDEALCQTLSQRQPNLPWEVTNQAAVHVWLDRAFGRDMPPFRSLEEGVASWPEYATCVGLTLEKDDSISVIAPHGLTDLYSMVVRHNPTRASASTYEHRVKLKQFTARWPKVRVEL